MQMRPTLVLSFQGLCPGLDILKPLRGARWGSSPDQCVPALLLQIAVTGGHDMHGLWVRLQQRPFPGRLEEQVEQQV